MVSKSAIWGYLFHSPIKTKFTYKPENYCEILFSNLFKEWSDERLRQTNEVLQGVRLLKLCGWENEFSNRILKTRNKELEALDKDSLYWALMSKT